MLQPVLLNLVAVQTAVKACGKAEYADVSKRWQRESPPTVSFT